MATVTGHCGQKQYQLHNRNQAASYFSLKYLSAESFPRRSVQPELFVPETPRFSSDANLSNRFQRGLNEEIGPFITLINIQ